MQQQTGYAAAFRAQRQALAERQHIGRELPRQLGQHAVQATYFKPDLSGGEGIEGVAGGDDDELRRVQPQGAKAKPIGLPALLPGAAILHPEQRARASEAGVGASVGTASQGCQMAQQRQGKAGGRPLITRTGRVQRMQAGARGHAT